MVGAALLATALALSACGSSAGPPPGAVVWVANNASVTYPGSRITPVNQQTGRSEATVDVGSLPSAFAFTRSGQLLVVTQGDDTLHEVDPATRAVVHSVGVGVEPDAVAVAPGGSAGAGIALVANLDSNSVTPVDLGTWKAGPAIPVGSQPVDIAVAVDGAGAPTAYVVDFGSDQVTPIDVGTMQAEAPITVGLSPETIAIAPGVALVGNFGDHTLTPIDTATGQAAPAVALPVDPTGIAVTTSGATAYVTGGASIVPIAVSGLALGAPIALPDVAQAIALNAGDTVAWVALQAGSVVPVTLATGAVGHPTHLRGHPSARAIDGG
jgi:hyaluronoglucosaminidase